MAEITSFKLWVHESQAHSPEIRRMIENGTAIVSQETIPEMMKELQGSLYYERPGLTRTV